MGEARFMNLLLAFWMGLSLVLFAVLLFIAAPYGRHHRKGWGPAIPARLGWLAMESVSLVAFNFFFMHGNRSFHLVTGLFCLLWNIHYLNRAFLYPARMRGGGRPMAVAVVLMAMLFNAVNGYLNGRYLNLYSSRYDPLWLLSPRFLLGAALFVGGFFINNHSDGVLRKLRTAERRGYAIPRGGFFRYVSCANYFGEIVEWMGWACMTWSWVGLTFAVWTAANLMPRAVSHHAWYRRNFEEYPSERRAVIPFIL